jgi:23S rRNA pseudouridine1911/1915/1917 synthase
MPRMTIVPAGQAPRRLDVFVSAQSARLSRAAAQRWIDRGLIAVNGRRAKRAQRIRPGDVITWPEATRARRPIEPESLPLDVLHEDATLLVVNKPRGLVMHPTAGRRTGTLLNRLVHHLGWHLGQGAAAARPGLVHRLDKGTSGVIVVAKTAAAHRDLSRQFHAHSVHRMYLALVAGAVRRGGVIDQALGRDARERRRVSSGSATPRRAVTEFRVAERLGPEATLLEVRPRTGRMHQIRVHLASIGHAVLGDSRYGAPDGDPGLAHPMLHAAVLGFVHPATGQYAEYRARLPADMERAVAGRRARVPSGPIHERAPHPLPPTREREPVGDSPLPREGGGGG